MNIKEKISKKHIIIGTSALVLIVGGITVGVIANNSDEQPANANVTETQPTTEQVTTTTTTNITTTITTTTTTTVTTTTMITTTKADEQKKKEEANKKEESSSSSNNNYYEEPDYSYEEPDNSYQEPVYQEPAYEEPAQSYDDGGEVSYSSDEELAAAFKEQGFSDEEIDAFLNLELY